MDRQYRRVSTEEQRRGGTSLEWQLTKLAEVAPDAIDYCDGGHTGTTGDRPDLQRLLWDVQLGDRVLVWKLDRLARNLRLLLEIECKLRDMKVPLISISESIDTSTALGRMTFQLLGMVAEWEREVIIERTKSGRYARYKEGKWGPGKTYYGNQYNPETKELEIREDEAGVVRRIYNLYVFDCLGLEKIAKLLNSEGIRTRQGNMWEGSSIGRILTHPGYRGKHPTGAKSPVIIEPELWDLAQKRLHDNPHLHRRRESPWLLQGVMHCGLCAHVLSCESSRGYRRYSCAGRRQVAHLDNSPRCKLPSFDAEWLEDEVFRVIMDTLSKPEGMVKAITDSIQLLSARRKELGRTIKPIQTSLDEIDKQLAKLAQGWVKGAIGDAKASEMRDSLEVERERLSKLKAEIHPGQIDELEHVRQTLKLYESGLALIKAGKVDGDFYIMDGLPSIGKPGSELTASDVTKAKRAILDRFQTEVWVFPDRIEIKGIALCPVIPTQDLHSAPRMQVLPVKLMLEIKSS